MNILDKAERERIIRLVKREVVPAIGCTEPICVALCVARATEFLNEKPESIIVKLSANILKNAMGVGIPGTGMVGLPIAIALGALIGKSDYQLEVLKDVKKEDVEEGKTFIAEKRIKIQLKEDITEKLYVEALVKASDGHSATAIIAGSHTHFVFLADGEKVQIIGFGTFEPRERAPRTGRNPKTNTPVPIPAKRVPFFKPGKPLKKMVEK